RVSNDSLYVGHCQRLGAKFSIFTRCEGQMKLCSAAAKQFDIGPIRRESLTDGCLNLAERRRLEFALERIERPSPSVTLVLDKALQNGNERGSPIGPNVFDPAEQGGRVAEIRLGQKTSNLYLDANTSL